MDMAKSTARNLTEGNIAKQIILFSLPLMLGNVFQMLYNTVDSIVVGNYVGTQALAAVGSTTMIVNLFVFFFNGFSIGAGVIIGRYFGSKDMDGLHQAIETVMAASFILCVLFTGISIVLVHPMLRLMATPADVFDSASVYLRIYFAGISGLLIYNIGSGILRAVGDTTRPLYFLILTSILNIILDLLFVLVFHLGIAGVAYATIIAQFVSAGLILLLLIRTKDVYRFTFSDMRIDFDILKRIFGVGMPAAIQSVLTTFSNIFVQGYINFFGSGVMAGWSCYNKIDMFIMLPMNSMAMAATTFVAQNMGARQLKRAQQGTVTTNVLTLSVTGVIAAFIYVFAPAAVALFTNDPAVIDYGVLFLRTNVFFLLFNCINHVLAGSLRGYGDSKAPMVIMLTGFVVIRQIYLFVMTRFISNTPALVGFSYPVGWMVTCALEVLYYFRNRNNYTV
ncbi:MAG: MATE family efflux transporter [Erysipelotrichaceae bacterium]|nr:MATE family efflux transporter [Erysipelotrichaceae bacterium]